MGPTQNYVTSISSSLISLVAAGSPWYVCACRISLMACLTLSQSPEHHEERLRQLAKETGKVVLSLNYVKAPEFVFPVAQEECFDAYRILQLSRGRVIGMSGSDDFQIIVTGDSAGGHMAASCMIRIIEYPDHHVRAAYQAKRTSLEEEQCRMLGLSMEDEPPPLPKAVGLLLAYPSVNFNYGLWLDHETLRVLRKQSERSLHEMGTPSDAVKVVDLGGPERSTRTRSRSNSRSRVSRKYSQAELRHMRRASGSFPDVSTLAAASQTPAAPTSPSQSTKPQRPEMARTKSLSHFSSLAGEARKHLAERAEFARAADTDESEEGLSQSVDTAQESGVEAPRIGQPLFDDPTVSGLPGLLVGSPMLDESVESTGSASLSRSASLAALLRKDEHLQEALARTKADEDARLEKQQASKSGPIETRLTMSSTASYFNDRILTPGMMRAMGILYIGPHRQPDLKTNYYLQPVIAPSSILAQFPPTLIVVGEKDPLCDDSVVLAGRIWEAKMARRAGTERKRAQQEQARTQLGEKLRMSFPAADHEQEEEWDEPEEEFVHLRVLEGWSHGFMQMSSIMPEAIKVIRFLGLWMDDTFDLFEERQAGREQAAAAAQSHFTLPRAKGPTSVSATPDHLSPMASPLAYPTPPLARSPRPRLAVSSAENNGASSEPEDGGLVFTPKRTTPLSGVNSPRLNGVGDDTKPGSFPCSGSVSPAHTAALRNEGGATSAFSSTGSLTPGTEALVTPSTAHGSSKRSAARKAADTETKDLLVAQQSLFQRRREAVTFGLEAASPLSNSADEDVRGEPSRRNSRK